LGRKLLCAVLALHPHENFSAKPSNRPAAKLKLFGEGAFFDVSVNCGALPSGNVDEFWEPNETIFRFLL
jgi:hypothetical protein